MCDNEADPLPPSSTSAMALRLKPTSGPLSLSPGDTATTTNFPFGSSPLSGLQTQVSPTALAEYQQRLQLYDYAAQAAIRFRLSHAALGGAAGAYGLGGHPALVGAEGSSSYGSMSPFSRYDPRFRFMHEEPKPQHSYIGLIAMAILSVSDKKMVLSDIYQHILDHYPYFRNRGPGWRNSIRHNLSLNDCFVKSGRSANGKGHYWAIHPANVEDFQKGDFRRRKAQRKVRKHMGLAVPEDEDSQSPTSTPTPGQGRPMGPGSFPPPPPSHPDHHHHQLGPQAQLQLPLQGPQLCANLASLQEMCLPFTQFTNQVKSERGLPLSCQRDMSSPFGGHGRLPGTNNKRQFDMESILAPDCDSTVKAGSMANFEERYKQSLSSFASTRVTLATKQHQSLCEASPVSVGSPRDDLPGSNCSSPSVTSSGVATPPPSDGDKQNDRSSRVSSNSSSHHLHHPSQHHSFHSLASWQAAQLQSLHNLHQINANLVVSQSVLRGTTNSGGGSHHHQQIPGLPLWTSSGLVGGPQTVSFFPYPSMSAASANSASPPRTMASGGQK